MLKIITNHKNIYIYHRLVYVMSNCVVLVPAYRVGVAGQARH